MPEFTYINQNTWPDTCDWKFQKKTSFDPNQVKKGDIVFVEYNSLREFRKVARKIKNPFILFTSNDDRPLPLNHRKMLKIKNVAAWFVGNIDCPPSDRLIPVPIGLHNATAAAMQSEIPSKERDIFAYVNFNISTNQKERQPCWDYFSTKNWAHVTRNRSNQEYVEDLSRSVFVISPPGNGLDCYRTWEAICLRCYPVVLSSTLNPLYEHLPVVIVDSWDEVTEELLKKKKDEFSKKEWNYETAYAPYWLKKVKTVQQEVRSRKSGIFKWFFNQTNSKK